VVASAACFATLGPISRVAYADGLTPLGFVVWRALFGAVSLAALLIVIGRAGQPLLGLRGVPRRQWLMIGVAGTASALMNLAVFIAFERISVALAMLGFYVYPVIVAVAVVATGRERLDAVRVGALALAMLGMALVVLGQVSPAGSPGVDLLGFAIVLVAACLNVVYIFAARDGYLALPARQATLAVLVVSEAWYLVLAVVAGQLAIVALPFQEPDLWPVLLLAGTLGAAVPVVLFTAGLRIVGGVRTSILMLLEPVVATLLAFVILDEGLAPMQLVGGALVLAAAVIVERRSLGVTGAVGRPATAPPGSG
jgi:drug/metabolite transporter (DMT)-like permease